MPRERALAVWPRERALAVCPRERALAVRPGAVLTSIPCPIPRRTARRPGPSLSSLASTASPMRTAGSSTSVGQSLRSRLNSYFADIAGLHPRTRQMVTSAAKVEWTVVTTEVEALQLEYNWIKEFDPRFNVRYRDDKSYPVLAVTLNEEYPRLMVYRGPRRKGVRYFGPYSHAWAIRETLDLLTRVFPARTCSAGFSSGTVRSSVLVCWVTSTSARPLHRAGQRRGPPQDRHRLLRLPVR